MFFRYYLMILLLCVSETVRDLIIVRLSASSGSVSGGDDMIILCEKVRKGDNNCEDVCRNLRLAALMWKHFLLRSDLFRLPLGGSRQAYGTFWMMKTCLENLSRWLLSAMMMMMMTCVHAIIPFKSVVRVVRPWQTHFAVICQSWYISSLS